MSLVPSISPTAIVRSFAVRGAASKGAVWFGAVVLVAVALRLAAYWWMARPFGGLSLALCHFDCDFYLRIAEGGYGVDAHFHDRGSIPNWAYFPLLPLLIWAAKTVTGWPPALCGVLLANAALAGFAIAGAAYIRRTRQDAEPGLWLLGLLASPYALFFTMPYTESLFALLATAVLLARATGRPMLAAGCACLCSATRPTGLILSALVLIDQARTLWKQRHRRGPEWHQALLAAALAPLGLVLFMAWQYVAIGDTLAFVHVQVSWDRRWLGPATWLVLGLRTGDWRDAAGLFTMQSYSFNAACALAGLALAIVLALRGLLAEAWLAAAAILLPLATGLHSMGRFVGTNPAILFAAYDVLHRLPRGGMARPGVLLAFGAVQAALIIAWYTRAAGLF